MKAINTKVIPVASYVMSVCRLTKENNWIGLWKMIEQMLREANMYGWKANDERLHLSKEHGAKFQRHA